MKFDEKFIEQLRSKLNIVDVVSGYCQLTRKGGSYWACCPLPGHSEKTPSFAVNESGQFYKCFGCGKGGDVIKFIMEMESLSFSEAVKLLCEKAHIPLPEDVDGKSEGETRKKYAEKERLQALMRDAALFYVDMLKAPQCEAHRKYLEKRRLTKKEVVAFGLGASPDYDSLVKYLHKKGYTMEEAMLAGAVQRKKPKNGANVSAGANARAKTVGSSSALSASASSASSNSGAHSNANPNQHAAYENLNDYFDALYGRLIFPIIDGFGKVIAFGGRMLEKTDFAKYKNTSDSVLFSKRKTLYNINNLKKEKNARGKLDYAIMVEGYMDTIALHKAGFRNVVASMGTSLTVEQARMLKRYTDVALICYDGDKAGQNATVRGLEILRDCGLEVRVVSLPDGLDPDELINQRGANAYAEQLKKALPLIDFKLKCVRNSYDITTVSGKRKYIEESLKVIGECENRSLQEELLKKLRDESGITYESLRRDLDNNGGGREEAEEPARAQAEAEQEVTANNADAVAERFVLDCYIRGESFVSGNPADLEYTDAFRTEIAEYVAAKTMLGQRIEADKLQTLAGDDNLQELMSILEAAENVTENVRSSYFSDCLAFLKERTVNAKIKKLKDVYKSETDVEKRKSIAAEITSLVMELAKLGKKR